MSAVSKTARTPVDGAQGTDGLPQKSGSGQASGAQETGDVQKGSEGLLSLATLAGRRRKEAQEALLEKIAGLLGNDRERTEKERLLIDDILVGLVRDAEIAIRSRLAESLADLAEPPRKLFDWLLEDEASVAGPLLKASPAVAEEQITGACARSHGHRLAVAERPRIGAQVSDALVSYGEADVSLALLRNETAQVSQNAFARIIKALGGNPEIAAALAARPDLSAGLAHQLFWSAASSLRRDILERFAITPDRVDRVLEDLAADGYGGLKPAFDEAASLGRDRLAKFGPISAMLAHVRAGNLPDFARDAARRLSIGPQTVRRVLSDPSGESIAVLCKALDLDLSQFTSLFLTLDYRRSGQARPAQQVDRIGRIFSGLSREQSLASLTLWDRVELV